MKKSRNRKRGTRRQVFAALLVCSVVGLLLPDRVTARLMNLFQVLVPLQTAANRGVEAIGDAVAFDAGPSLPPDEAARLIEENVALRHTVASLRLSMAALEDSRRELAGLRGMGLAGRLIPAHVVAPDVLGLRSSQLIDAGSLRGVLPGAAVVSNHFAVHLGEDEGVRNGQAVLAAEVFVGTVDALGTHTARVKLVSDPSTRMVVWIARDVDEAYEPLDRNFWLTGAGRGRARIADVDRGYVEAGAVRVGDGVFTADGDPRLPRSVMIGTIESISADPDNPLLNVLDVGLAVEPEELRRVYVVDPIDR